jgi:hypothetical protein
MTQDELKKSKEKLSPKVKVVQKKKKPAIDFEKPRKTIKGISICAICKIRHLECKKCFMDNGEQLIFCNSCYLRQRSMYFWKNNDPRAKTIYKLYRMPGSYGSGKKR